MTPRLIAAATIVAALAAGTGVGPVSPAPAAGQVPTCAPEFAAGPGGYRFARCQVPDFDQLRFDLAMGGRSHCMPTSAADWLVYLIERGATSVRPGPDWGTTHDDISTIIHAVGNRMGTVPGTTENPGGTETGNAVEGLIQWFDESYGGRGGDYFSVWQKQGLVTTDGGLGTRIEYTTADELAEQGASGALVIALVGWYVAEGDGYWRSGGHAVALASARPAVFWEGRPGDIVLGLNDPSDHDRDPTAQGPMVTERIVAAAQPSDIVAGSVTRRLEKLSGDAYNNGWLEGMLVIHPKFGLFPEPDGHVQLRRSLPLEQWPTEASFDGLDGRVIDLALRPSGVHHTALLDDGRMVTLDQVTGDTTPVGTFPGATDIVIDDQLRTALLDRDGRITVLDRHGNPATTLDVPGATGLEYSPRLGALVSYDRAARQLLLIDDGEDGAEPTIRRLSLGSEGPPIGPNPTLSVDPVTGVIGLLDPGTNHLVAVTISENRFTTVTELHLGDGAPLEGLVADATGRGTWYSTRDGRIVAFDAEGNELPENPFAGQPSTSAFAIFQPMDIGEGPEGPHVMPQDAPGAGIEATASPATATREIGETHDVRVELRDGAGNPHSGRTVTYTINGANPSDGVTTTGADGRATIAWTGTSVGEDALLVETDAGARATARVTWVAPAPIATSMTLTSSANPAIAGRPVTLTATVVAADPSSSPAGGTVRFADAGRSVGPPVAVEANGQARVTTTWPTAGRHPITATYTPPTGSRLLASSAALDLRVRCHLLDLVCVIRGLLE